MELGFDLLKLWGAVRADHPMFPIKDNVYYFEVKIEKVEGIDM